MDEFSGKDIQFVSDWLKASNLENLVDVFEGMYTLNTFFFILFILAVLICNFSTVFY
jgi:hypothetical protein